ncbi:MAG: hypothetical protein GYB55_17540 [Cytophagales bacterium]|uniref:hypothetical protein n=1 Tax=Cyclobacterium marinum TaxID=104 RepID=UPI0030D8E43B|nr:hypothetical protein [Cytophagales bacterium]|tara:strand:+ start:37202 stop:38416 length:1215 start_codon:yes stop_codon:yes gene_type:complete
MRKSWLLISLINFFIAALMGLLLRAAFVWDLYWMEYKNMLHGHSHLALLGWLYLGLFVLIHGRFLDKEKASKAIYTRLFWLTQFSVVGMMLSFPLQGYAGFSIFFSSLHIVLSYVFVYRVWKDHRKESIQITLLLRTALLFLLISTCGVWAVAVIMANGGGGGVLYQVAIQFYLHFQFNGWLLFGVLALIINDFKPKFSPFGFQSFYFLMCLSQVLTFGLILFWAYRWNWTFGVNFIGVGLQLLALGALLSLRKDLRFNLTRLLAAHSFLLLAFIVGVIRVVAQVLLIFPDIADRAVSLRTTIIGFIHLNMLGLFSAYLLYSFFKNQALVTYNKQFKWVVIPFFIGFIGSELILFFQGFSTWRSWHVLSYYHESLLAFSGFIPLGIAVYIVLFLKYYSYRPAEP